MGGTLLLALLVYFLHILKPLCLDADFECEARFFIRGRLQKHAVTCSSCFSVLHVSFFSASKLHVHFCSASMLLILVLFVVESVPWEDWVSCYNIFRWPDFCFWNLTNYIIFYSRLLPLQGWRGSFLKE